MRFKHLPHTADAMIEAYGSTLEEAFINAALGVTDIMVPPEEIEAVEEKKIEIESNRKMSLLYDFIEEIIVLTDTDGFIVREVKNLKIEQRDKLTLICTFIGDNYKNYELKTAIKSMTYSDMFIDEQPDKVTIRLTVDI